MIKIPLKKPVSIILFAVVILLTTFFIDRSLSTSFIDILREESGYKLDAYFTVIGAKISEAADKNDDILLLNYIQKLKESSDISEIIIEDKTGNIISSTDPELIGKRDILDSLNNDSLRANTIYDPAPLHRKIETKNGAFHVLLHQDTGHYNKLIRQKSFALYGLAMLAILCSIVFSLKMPAPVKKIAVNTVIVPMNFIKNIKNTEVIILNNENSVIYANDASRLRFGIDILGKNVTEVRNPEVLLSILSKQDAFYKDEENKYIIV